MDSICKDTTDATDEVRQAIARAKQDLLQKYGPTIPVNTAHRISWELEGNGQMWSDSPGCFERHLQRRDGSLLFTPERRIVTHQEIEEAREKDRTEQEQFTAKFKAFATTIASAIEMSVPLDKDTSVLLEVQQLLEEAAAIGGEIAQPLQVLENTEQALVDSMRQASPDGADLLRSMSVVKRSPYFAQFTRKDSPILREEEIPALLSEDLDTISFAGFMSRAFGPDFRPNGTDIESHLERAAIEGFSRERAARIMTEWNKGRNKADEAGL